MAFAHSPKISTKNLVFYYDTSNGKSFPGEPTTNLFPSPQLTNNSDTTVGTASITLKNFGGGLIGLEMVQATTSDIVSFGMGTLSSAVSGGTYTWSSYVNCTSTGNKVKAQVTVRVDGVRHWLTNSNTWATSTTECSHLFTPTIANKWHRVDTQITMPTGTLTDFQLGGFYRATSTFTLRVANAQLELKSHPTPFTTGTRAVSTGLKDLAGKTSMDLSNVSFDSTAQMTFDATNDRIVTSIANLPTGSAPRTVTAVVRVVGTSSHYYGITGYGASSAAQTFDLGFREDGDTVFLDIYGAGGISSTNSITRNEWFTITGVYTGTQLQLYLNGELEASNTYAINTASSNFLIGDTAWGYPLHMNGDIASVKIYNKALTAAEVQANFNAIKGRFGI